MTNIKSTKRALLMSVVALFLCFTMLMGTTYAWFTDSVTSTGNKIVAGTLDVKLLMHNGTEYADISTAADPIIGAAIFGEGTTANADTAATLWEPGKTQTVYLAIENAGNLDLKYQVALEVKNVTNNLTDVVSYAITPDAQPTDVAPDKIEGWVGNGTNVVLGINPTVAQNVALGAGDIHYFALSVHMDEEAGNAYMNGSIEFDIKVLATQLTSEFDSFNNQYDKDADYAVPVSSTTAFLNAIYNGEDVLLETPLTIDETFINELNSFTPVMLSLATIDDTQVIDTNAEIDGNGSTIYRTEDTLDKPLFTVKDGYTLTLSNIILDGGAKWTGEIDPVLLRGTTNSGITASGVIVQAEAGAHIVLNEGAVLQNNDGTFAVNLTRSRNGSSLTLDGGEIINNHADGGAIWGGGKITVNAGKINGNSSKSIAGAVRMLNNNAGNTISFTMNGGEINHNKAATDGGAIWCGGNANYTFNGGEIAYNHAGGAGGAIEGQPGDNQYISGDFELHHNTSGDLGSAIHFSVGNTHTTFKMTGGKIYANGGENDCDIFAWNKYVTLLGGEIDGKISYTGGLILTVGDADVNYVDFNTSRGDYKIYLDTEIGTLKYMVNEEHSLLSAFMLQPAEGYTYTEGDEDKLICLNEGYTTYWDETTSTFRLQANN